MSLIWKCKSKARAARAASVASAEPVAADDDDEEETVPLESKVYREGNHIYFYAEVDRATVSLLNKLIREAEEFSFMSSLKLRVSTIPIWLHIFSDGGYIHAALAAVDTIQGCGVPVYSVIEGATASAGTIMSIACTKRYIRPSAYMLIHQLSSGCWGKLSEITDEYTGLTDLMAKIRGMYAERTKLTEKKLTWLLKHDLWLNATKSIKYGLADELYA
jgi:ATP-dependent Clp protease protease subunit